MKELVNIQSSLQAPKNQYNDFGNYKYRSAEDILEAAKPLLKENECTLIVSDEITQIGDRIYVKATATIKNSAGETETASAFAREAETKKGMDDSQVTGSATSYARKYALGGLFCIDDTKDADALNTTKEYTAQKKTTQKAAPPIQTSDNIEEAKKEIANAKSEPELQTIAKKYRPVFNAIQALLTERKEQLIKQQ